MIVLAACLAFLGCLSLALSQDGKWKIVAGTAPVARTRAALRISGWVLLGVTLAVCIAAEGPGFAVLLWTLLVSVACFVVAMTLSFRPTAFRPFARACSTWWP